MAKLITKFKYIKPGNGAGSYLKYIATREGVEKIDDSKKLLPTTAKQKILIAKLLRDFPDSREMLEYEDYRAEKTIGAASEFITRAIEDNAHSMMTSKTYADYIATRPRAERFGSHGLFTDDGVEIKLTEVSEELNRHEGNVWTAIVSLRREDAERLGFNRGARWRDMLRTQTQALSENRRSPWRICDGMPPSIMRAIIPMCILLPIRFWRTKAISQRRGWKICGPLSQGISLHKTCSAFMSSRPSTGMR